MIKSYQTIFLILKYLSKHSCYKYKKNKDLLQIIKEYDTDIMKEVKSIKKCIIKEKKSLNRHRRFIYIKNIHTLYNMLEIHTDFSNLSDYINQILSSIDINHFDKIIEEDIIDSKKNKKYDLNIDLKSLYEIIYQIDFEKSPKPVLNKKLLLDLVENGQSYFDHNWDKLNVYVDNLANIKGKTVGQVCKELSIISSCIDKMSHIVHQSYELYADHCYLSDYYADYLKTLDDDDDEEES